LRLQKLITTYITNFCDAVRMLQPFKHTNEAGSLKHNLSSVLLHRSVCQMEKKKVYRLKLLTTSRIRDQYPTDITWLSKRESIKNYSRGLILKNSVSCTE